MAKKYRKQELKIHPLTIAGIFGFIAVLVLLIVLTAPNARQKLFRAYESAQYVHGSYIDTNKFNENHVFVEINSNQILNAIAKDELIIIFFGNPNDANSFTAIQDVHGRFVGFSNTSETVAASALFANEKLTKLRHHTSTTDQLNALVERINDQISGTKMKATSVPVLIAFKNNQIIAEQTALTGQIGIRNIRDFYQEVYELVFTE